MKILKQAILISLLAISSNSFADLTTGLIAYYPFNGNANDESGNGNNGTVYGATLATDRLGKSNSAYHFDGNSYISVQNSASLSSPSTQYTVAVWANTSAWYAGGLSSLVCKGVTTSQYRPAFSSDGGFLFHAGVEVYTNYSVDLNKWYFFVEVWNNGIAQVYVNGQKIGEISGGTPVNVNSESLEIGRDQPGAVEYMNGLIDDVRIYNRVLSVSEIQQLYQEGTSSQYLDVAVIPDVNGDGVMDQSVLAIKSGKYYLRTIDGITGKQLNQMALGAATAVTPSALTLAGNQISVLITKSGGVTILQLHDSATLILVKTLTLPK